LPFFFFLYLKKNNFSGEISPKSEIKKLNNIRKLGDFGSFSIAKIRDNNNNNNRHISTIGFQL
jgi:hypothetical protein